MSSSVGCWRLWHGDGRIVGIGVGAEVIEYRLLVREVRSELSLTVIENVFTYASKVWIVRPDEYFMHYSTIYILHHLHHPHTAAPPSTL